MGHGQSTSPFRFAIGDRVERLFGNRREIAAVTDRCVGSSGGNWYLIDGSPSSGAPGWEVEGALAPISDSVGIVWRMTTPDEFLAFGRRRAAR